MCQNKALDGGAAEVSWGHSHLVARTRGRGCCQLCELTGEGAQAAGEEGGYLLCRGGLPLEAPGTRRDVLRSHRTCCP